MAAKAAKKNAPVTYLAIVYLENIKVVILAL